MCMCIADSLTRRMAQPHRKKGTPPLSGTPRHCSAAQLVCSFLTAWTQHGPCITIPPSLSHS